MANCLVTKLKGVVDNDDLMKLGVFRIKVSADFPNDPVTPYVEFAQIVSSKAPLKVQVKNGYIANDENGAGATADITVGINSRIPPYATPGAIVEISSKYDITSFGVDPRAEFDFNEVGYWSLTFIGLWSRADKDGVIRISCYGDFCKALKTNLSLKNIECTWAHNIPLNKTTITGNVEDLKDLDLISCDLSEQKLLEGDVAVAFGKMINLTSLRLFNNNITGTLESLVQAWRANGRTSIKRSANFKWEYMQFSKITFNGAVLPWALGNEGVILYYDLNTITVEKLETGDKIIVNA